MVAFDAFAALDIRTGRVTACRPNDAARVPAHIFEVDFGELGQRIASAQITNYDCEALVGRTVIGVLNIGSRRIAGVRSDFLGHRLRAAPRGPFPGDRLSVTISRDSSGGARREST